MAAWGVTVGCVLAVGAVACSGADGDTVATTLAPRVATSSSTTAPTRPTSTTTTVYDPATVEGQVEAAYLRSWEVYADAVYNLRLDETALAEVYAERSLETRRTEIQDRIHRGRAAWVSLDHDYQIVIVDESTAAVIDHFVNHQVLVDRDSKAPAEPDPNERLLVNFQMKRAGGVWRVTLIQKVNG